MTGGVNPTAGSVYEEDYADPPSLSFANTAVGSTSGTQTVTATNIGNAALDFEIPGSGDNPNIAPGFTLASGTGDCPLVTSGSTSVGTLASGASCSLIVAFAPQAAGSYSGSTLVLTDNNANDTSPYATQTIDLSGTGTGTDKASYLEITGTSLVTAGVQSSITVKAYDALGHVFTGYTGTVHFTSSDPAAVLPANSALSSGTGTFNLTLKTAGNQTVTATDTSTSLVTGSIPITVDPGTATHLGVSAPSSATAGTSFGIAVSAYDAYGNVASGYGGTVHFTSTDGSASLPANSGLSSGEGNFTATLNTSGIQTITATDTSTSITGTSNSITVDKAPAITSAASATFMVGSSGSFTATATGYPAPTFSETGTLPSGVTLASNGALSGTPASGTAGSYPFTITASNGISPNATQSFTLTVNPPPNLVVTNMGDDSGTASNCTVQSSTTTGTDGSCSLRDALLEAVSLGAGNIYFDTTKFAGATTVTLTNGTLTLPSNTTIQGLTATVGGVPTNLVTVSGGGSSSNFPVFTVNPGVGNTAIANLTITKGNNTTTTSSGGGILNQGALTVSNSTLSGNSAPNGVGGGIYNSGSGTLTVVDSTISGNVGAGSGGGLANNGGTMTVIDSTISGNSLTDGSGAGITNVGTLTIRGSTVVDNTAHFLVGGIWNISGTLTLSNSIVAGNSANSIYADIWNEDTFTDDGGNIASDNSSATSTIDPQLSPLQYNGIGATVETMIPLPGSPAICAGLAANIPTGTTTDQRGYPNTNTTYTGYSSTTPCVDSGAVQTDYTSVAFVQQPTNTLVSTSISPSPTVEVLETDANLTANNTDAVNGIPVTLTLAEGSGTLGGTLTQTASGGVATFGNLTVSAPGTSDELATNAITVVSNGTGTTTLAAVDSSTFEVIGSTTHFVVSATSPVAAGSASSVIVTAEDVDGNTTPAYTGTVHFTSSDAAAVLPANFTFTSANNGQQTFSATLKTAGNQTVTATDTSNGAIAGTSNAIAVSVGPAAQLVASSGTPQSGYVGQVFANALTATVTDVYGNGVSGETLNFTAPGSGASATLSAPSCTTGANGSCSVTATANGTAGGYSVTAAVSGITGSVSFALTNLPPPGFVVTTAADDAVGTAANCPAGGGSGLDCRLRDALAAATLDGSGNITFSSTVFLTSNTTALNTITLTHGTLDVPSNTTITGATSGSGATLTNLVTVSGGGPSSNFSVFTVGTGVTGAAIANLSIVNGYSSSSGGGVNNAGTLTVSSSTFSGNSASVTGGADGGGIYQAGGTLTVTNSTFSGNSASVTGGTGGTGIGIGSGGIYQAGGTLTVTNSILSDVGSGDFECSGSGCPANGTSGNIVDPSGTLANLAALGNYGGTTQTMLPLPESTAICAGLAANLVSTTDERGESNKNTTYTGYSSTTPCVDSGAVQTDYALNFTAQQPSNATPGTSMSPAPIVTVTESGSAFTAGPATVSLADADSDLSASSTASASTASGEASFGNLQFTAPETGDTLTATLALTSSLNVTAVSGSFNVSQIAQTISFTPAITSYTYSPSGSFPVSATASSSLAVSFASTTGSICSVSGTTVSILSAGTCTIQATQTGNTDYSAATAVAVNFTINQVSQTIGFSPAITSYTYSPSGSFAVSATASSTLAVSFASTTGGICSVSGTTVTILSAGTCTVQATQAGNTDYSAATPVPVDFTINQATQAIAFTPPASPVTYGVSPVSLTATGGASGNAVTFSVVSGPGSVSGNMLTVTGANNSIVIAANQAGNTDYTAATPVTQSILVDPASLTVAANSAARVYGTANPAFSGTVTGMVDGNSFAESFATAATASSDVGAYSIVPSVTGAGLANYTQDIEDGTLAVTQAGTTTSLNVSNATVTPGESVTLSAQVASATSGTPGGMVSFYDGASLLDTATLSAGTASYQTASLTPGIAHSITAAYNGSIDFTASSSATTATVTVAPLDFTMTLAGPSAATVVPGSTITYKVAVTPEYGAYAGTVSFAVSGLPPGATASFSPASIAANGGPQTITVTIQTAPATAAAHTPPPPSSGRRAAPFALAFLLFGAGSLRKRGQALRRLLCIGLLLAGGAAATLTLSGCTTTNGFFAQAPENYTVTVAASSGNLQHTASLTLNLQ